MNYPSPCDKCTAAGCVPKECAEYHKYICSWWKHFNGVYKQLCAPRRADPKSLFTCTPMSIGGTLRKALARDARHTKNATLPALPTGHGGTSGWSGIEGG